jgi:thermostable 8-oxoguanine DNA glycosylase
MIDPTQITNFSASDEQLEELALFWICAAGKNGKTAARLLDTLLQSLSGSTPFDKIRSTQPEELPSHLKAAGIGCQNSKAKSMLQLAHSTLNLRTCLPEDLETIHGIGRKTSRCFILHSREHARYAALDTHILKFLREQGHDAPISTPASAKKYAELENAFLSLADKSGKSVAEFDLEIWNYYAV